MPLHLIILQLLQVFFRILPANSECLSYNLYPLIPGYVRLPKLHLNTPCAPTMTEEVSDKMMPSHIYIKVRIERSRVKCKRFCFNIKPELIQAEI